MDGWMDVRVAGIGRQRQCNTSMHQFGAVVMQVFSWCELRPDRRRCTSRLTASDFVRLHATDAEVFSKRLLRIDWRSCLASVTSCCACMVDSVYNNHAVGYRKVLFRTGFVCSISILIYAVFFITPVVRCTFSGYLYGEIKLQRASE